MGIKFVGVRKDRWGNITHFLTNHGKVVSIQEARVMAMEGAVDSLTDVHADGAWHIAHSAGDGGPEQEYNLDQLPEF